MCISEVQLQLVRLQCSAPEHCNLWWCLRNLNPDTRKFGQFHRSWFTSGYTPENQHRTWNLALGRGDSVWKPAFSGFIFVFFGLAIHIVRHIKWDSSTHNHLIGVQNLPTTSDRKRTVMREAFSRNLQENFKGKPGKSPVKCIYLLNTYSYHHVKFSTAPKNDGWKTTFLLER